VRRKAIPCIGRLDRRHREASEKTPISRIFVREPYGETRSAGLPAKRGPRGGVGGGVRGRRRLGGSAWSRAREGPYYVSVISRIAARACFQFGRAQRRRGSGASLLPPRQPLYQVSWAETRPASTSLPFPPGAPN
jgi:hypothetical protein